jgi:hypothetical protein
MDNGFPRTPAKVVTEIQQLYRDGMAQNKIAAKLGMGRATVFKYCRDMYTPGQDKPLSTHTISGLMATWK